MQAAQRGYQLAADDPARGAQLLTDANPGAFTEPELVSRSQEMLAQRTCVTSRGGSARRLLEKWSGYSGFVFDSGVLTGPDGKPLTQRPDFATWFTNDYLAPPP